MGTPELLPHLRGSAHTHVHTHRHTRRHTRDALASAHPRLIPSAEALPTRWLTRVCRVRALPPCLGEQVLSGPSQRGRPTTGPSAGGGETPERSPSSLQADQEIPRGGDEEQGGNSPARPEVEREPLGDGKENLFLL